MVSIPPDAGGGRPASRRGRRAGGATATLPPGARPENTSTNGLPTPDLRATLPPPDPAIPHGRARPPSRVRRSLRLLGIPVTAVVVLELVAAAVLLTPDVPLAAEAAVLAVAIAVALSVLVPYRGLRLGTWVVGALSYATRRRVFTAVPDRATAGPDSGLAAVSNRRPGGPDGADGGGDEPVAVPAEVRAFFPDLEVVRSSSRSGQEIGLMQWQSRWVALVGLDVDHADVLSTSPPVTVPVQRLLAALAGRNFGLDAVQVLTQALQTNVDRFGDGALARIGAELAGFAPLARQRQMWIAIRIDPVHARRAIDARGGGMQGLGRLAAAALSRLESEAQLMRLVATPLPAVAAVQAMAGALLAPTRAADAPVRWTETWRAVESHQSYHRSFVVTSWRDASLDTLAVGAGYGVTVAHEVTGIDGDGGLQAVSVVRLTATAESALERASQQFRSQCRTLGVGVRLLRGQQAAALRMTVPGGQR